MMSEIDKKFEESGLKKLGFKDYDGALQDFKSAINYNPNNLNALFQIGNVFTAQNNSLAAITIFEGLIKLCFNQNNNSILRDSYYYLGYNYYTTYDFLRSLLFFNKAEEYIDSSFAHLSQLYHYRGVSLLHLGKVMESLPDFNKAIELKIDYESAYCFRAYAYMQLKMYEAAIVDYNHAAFFKPNPEREDFEVYTNYAVCLYNVGKYEEAKQKFLIALELNPENDVAKHGMNATNKKLGFSNQPAQSIQDNNLEGEDLQFFFDSKGQVFNLGESVIHSKFGLGEVRQILKQGNTSKAIIDFGAAGKKTLIAMFTTLSKVANLDI